MLSQCSSPLPIKFSVKRSILLTDYSKIVAVSMFRILANLILLLIVGLAGFYYIREINPSLVPKLTRYFVKPCTSPLEYRIGYMDPKFEISHESFLTSVRQAENAWEKASGRDLYQYNADADLTVNLIYDPKQTLELKYNELEHSLENKKAELEPTEKQYQEMVIDFKVKINALNAEVQEWNNKGGAPPEAYQQLVQRQNELRAEADRINDLGKTLNKSVEDYNKDVSALQGAAKTLNQAISKRPEQGIFDPNENRIDIYVAVDKNELVHTLSHELGHALGLDHTEDEKAIMYAFTTGEITPSKSDLEALESFCSS
jgi:hypothetical protein